MSTPVSIAESLICHGIAAAVREMASRSSSPATTGEDENWTFDRETTNS
ncbi:MAG: hypothetical protein M1294_06140 [Firmicutes bacterium]|nr:hypothetical protein [Bacillota bacterium]MCL5013259.1 hypothetical protein [Bacillota bacterium]